MISIQQGSSADMLKNQKQLGRWKAKSQERINCV